MRNLVCCGDNAVPESTELTPLTTNEPGEASDSNDVPSRPQLPENCGNPISWSEIMDGTENQSETKLIGQGNFGNVFRCNFPNSDDSKMGAVKIQKQGNELGDHEFVAEVTTLHAANHPNVIKLLGRCNEINHHAIVYEFMPNSSVDRHILAPLRPGSIQRPPLDWKTRMDIAVGVANALVYVHRTLKKVHRDIKAGNVLLDENFVPKLTDFGLAIDIVTGDHGAESQRAIRPVKGTHGWVAPETQTDGYVSTKTDVFSYGVFLIHLFTGRKPCDEDRSILIRNLADWFLQRACEAENFEPRIVDAALADVYSLEGLRKIFATAKMCIHRQARVRPTMNMVATMVRGAAIHSAQENSPVTPRIL